MGFDLLIYYTTKVFFTGLFFTFRKIPKVEKHDIQEIIAQRGSSFPLPCAILAGRLDAAQ